MAYQRKQYRNGKPRGGIEGKAVDSGYGAPGNHHKSKKRYPGDLFRRNGKQD